jgi:4-hydroxy-3-methylbut-2-enyl diphosphate reductase
MKLIFAKQLGFCTGVRNAIETARNSLKKDEKPVWFLGEIIHNEKITEEIKRKGGKTIHNPKDAKKGTLIIRAHGASPLPELKKTTIRDATCPLVKRAQNVAKKFVKERYKTIIIGEKKHPEVQGILGNAKGKPIVVENQEQAKKIKPAEKMGILAQTTQSQSNVDEILKILTKKAKFIKWENTLCPQVSFRQKELARIIKKADGILVIGSKTSANTQRLVKIAEKKIKSVWCSNSVEELKKIPFQKISALGVVSGTSAPDWEVKKITDFLKKYAKKKN